MKTETVAATPAPAPEQPSVNAALEDAFYNDPLIQAALVKFEGKVVA